MIPNTQLLVSAATGLEDQHSSEKTNFEVFDIGKQRRVFEFGKTVGCEIFTTLILMANR